MEKKTIRFKSIKCKIENLVVEDNYESYFRNGVRFTDPEQIYNGFKWLKDETKEHFIAVHLDGKNRMVCIDVVSIGSLNQCIVHPREVFKSAIVSNAAAIILLHNHPTGDTVPSQEDISITRRLREASEILGIKILDHLIIGDNYYSFVGSGLM